MFGNKKELQKIFSACDTTLKKYRKFHWTENIHWFRINSRKIIYNLDLIQDWLENKNNPCQHNKNIIKYLAKNNKK
jgi:hypothetical protein